MAQITYTDKVALNENPEIAAINKVSDDDMNEIKSVVNANYNNTIQITNSQPTDSDNKIWIDTGEIAQAHTEITNEYSTSTGLGYSANYVNKKFGIVLFEDLTNLGQADNITLNDSIDNYKEIEIFYNRYGLSKSIKVPTDVRITSTNPNDIFAVCDIPLFINNLLRIYTTTYKITGTSMTRNAYTYWNTNASSPTTNLENQITITKVIGYK